MPIIVKVTIGHDRCKSNRDTTAFFNGWRQRGCMMRRVLTLMLAVSLCLPFAMAGEDAGINHTIDVEGTPIDSIVLAVSFKLSPLFKLEVPGEKSRTSAPNWRAAIPKEIFVRVLFSTKKLKILRPLRGAALRSSSAGIPFRSSDNCKICSIWGFERSLIPRRCLEFHFRHC